MKISKKPAVSLIAGALLMVAAPAVYADHDGGDSDRNRGGDRDDRGDRGDRNRGDRRDRLDVVGLTQDSRLISFRDDKPDDARNLGRITGLLGDARLVGIDYRPSTGNNGSRGVLYGLGDAGGVYTLDRNARATKRSQLNVALQGSSFGVDFNPAVDRLRIISDTGQNLRDNVDTNGDTIVDGTLTYPGPPAMTATGVTGAAYTNNDADPNTSTTLFDIDSTLDQTVIQSPANSGQLAATGKLGVDTSPQIGSDIYSTIRNGTTVDLRGLASLTVGGRSRLYRISLLQGRAKSRGAFRPRNQVTGIAIPLNQL